MPRHNKQEQQFLAMKVGETRINGTNGNTEYWSGDNYGWQSENGYNEALTKEKERADSAVDKPLWDAVDTGKEAVGHFIAGIPGVKEAAGAVHFVTTKIQETAQYDRDNGSNGGDYSPANIAVGVAGAWQQGVDQFASGARSNYQAVESLIENSTGVELDDRGRDAYAGVLTAVAEGIAEGGAGGLVKAAKNIPLDPPKQLALAPVSGGVQLGNAAQIAEDNVFRLTAGEKYRVPGRSYEGMAADYPEALESIEKAERRAGPRYAPGERTFNEYISNSPQFKDQPLNPVAYHKFIRKNNYVKNYRRTDVEQFDGKLFKKMEQHHLFPVGESGPFIERMRNLVKDGIGDNDDVVNMFMYADYLGATMGHRWSNMLNMHQAPHKGVHRAFDVDTTGLRKELAEINTVDELYEKMHNHIIDRIIPAKTKALDDQIEYLTKNTQFDPVLLEEALALRDAFKGQIAPKQLNAIDDYIAALRARGA